LCRKTHATQTATPRSVNVAAAVAAKTTTRGNSGRSLEDGTTESKPLKTKKNKKKTMRQQSREIRSYRAIVSLPRSSF
jgi:hypothetical protein